MNAETRELLRRVNPWDRLRLAYALSLPAALVLAWLLPGRWKWLAVLPAVSGLVNASEQQASRSTGAEP